MPRVLVAIADPGLALRIGHVLAEAGIDATGTAVAASLLVTDRPPPEDGGGGGGPAFLVLARGLAAVEAARAGARAVLPPTVGPEQMAAAVEAVGQGLVVLARPVAEALGRAGRADGDGADPADVAPPGSAAGEETAGGGLLTPREAEVAALLACGASNKQIARQLSISFFTAKAHVASVLAKLGASSRADAVARAVRLGLVML